MFLVEKITEINYESQDENPPHLSGYEEVKYLQQTMNSMNIFLMWLVRSYVVSQLKLLRIFWYISMNYFELT